MASATAYLYQFMFSKYNCHPAILYHCSK